MQRQAGKYRSMRGRSCCFVYVTMAFGSVCQSGSIALAQSSPIGSKDSQGKSEVHVLPVQGNVYMLTGAGGNITLQTGKDGLLLVDTGLAEVADQTLAAIRTVSKDPIRFILNTHVHRDHTGG